MWPGRFSCPHANAVMKTPRVYLTRGVFLTVTPGGNSIMGTIISRYTGICQGLDIGFRVSKSESEGAVRYCFQLMEWVPVLRANKPAVLKSPRYSIFSLWTWANSHILEGRLFFLSVITRRLRLSCTARKSLSSPRAKKP